MGYTDAVDTIIASLTLEARGLLARSKFGDVVYRYLGWHAGRGGYQMLNPVKVEPLVDGADQAVGYIEVLDNTFDAGDKVLLNGVEFTYTVHWNVGATIPATVQNIVTAINDSSDYNVKNQVIVDVDPGDPNRIRVTSGVLGNVLATRTFTFLPAAVNTGTDVITLTAHGLTAAVRVQVATTGTLPNGVTALTNYYVCNVTTNTFQLSTSLNTPTLVDMSTQGTGVHSIVPTGNLFPLNRNETTGFGSTVNFLVTPMTLSVSTFLDDPVYPVPPALGSFVLPDGRIEEPSTTSASFVMRIPEGSIGLNGYGEIALWAEVLESTHPMEKGRKVLFAYAHFPLQCKTDRSNFTFRVIINF